MPPSPLIKICCIQDEHEASLALRHQPAVLGLVARMPSGPGPISDDRIAAIARMVPPPTETFLLTSEVTADAIVAHHARTGTTGIQLVDRLAPGTHQELRRRLPGVRLIQVIHVQDDGGLVEALNVATEVDGLLLDSGRPGLAVKELGGTGRTHDWEISRRIREAVRVPVFLAGGLRAENVREAIAQVRPAAVDVCSGVRTNGALDPAKLAAFVAAVRD
jgi:phosphoribosylanthranilate isomerase